MDNFNMERERERETEKRKGDLNVEGLYVRVGSSERFPAAGNA